jgi:hypothetical protein
MVIFRSTEGKAGYHPAETLEDAIRFVERLRNAEGVEQARIFRLEEVAFEFKPYFKVEVGGATPVSEDAPAAEAAAPETLAEAVAAPEVDELAELGPIAPEVVPEEIGANGRRGLFGR